MKKFAIFGLAALLVVAFSMPASALESIFGGYWRTRAYTQQDFTGDDSETENVTRIDTRTRLYYTAVLNDNLRFVNKFEFNAIWGDNDGGDIGTDGDTFRVKHSYADFDMGPINAKVGLQGIVLARGFLFDDDFAGAVISFNGTGISFPIIWMRPYENSVSDKDEVDYFAVAPTFGNETFSITPFGMYVYSNNASKWGSTSDYDAMNMWYAGADLDINVGALSLWGTGIYQGGEADLASNPNQSVDFKAWLAAAGLSIDLAGKADLHGQAFYATGPDEDDAANNEKSDFFVPLGQSYYWSEIMGFGIFDNKGIPAYQNGAGDQIGNILAGNVGTTIKATDDLKISLDAWYAKLAEEIEVTDSNGNTTKEDELGIEANVTITYQLVEGLNLDLVGAYLFAGDAVTKKAQNDKNPYEIGTRLSLEF
jgi:hypothetical protein